MLISVGIFLFLLKYNIWALHDFMSRCVKVQKYKFRKIFQHYFETSKLTKQQNLVNFF